jgi:hypothetical protein
MREWLRSNGGWPAVVLLGVVLAGLKVPIAAGWALVGFGALMFVLTRGFVQRRVPWRVSSKVDVHDPFWVKVFDSLPPAFIKEYPHDRHIVDNSALRVFQGEKPSEILEDDQARITKDHEAGDTKTATKGASVQLELSDAFPGKHPRPILTFKKRVKHDGRTFIVGWYVPVELPSEPSLRKQELDLRECGGQVLFGRLQETTDDPHPFVIDVGQSIRHGVE